MKLLSNYSNISNLCDHDTTTSQRDRQIDGRLTIALPRAR